MNSCIRHLMALLVTGWVGSLALDPLAMVAGAESASPAVSAIHPERRMAPSPGGGELVTVNPPPLLWPAARGSDVRYEVQLSASQDFPKAATIRSDGIRWALFNPHRKLSTGTWYWKYRATGKSRPAPEWSPVNHFTVLDTVRLSVTPPATQIIAAIPREHPRILVSANQLALLRRRAEGSSWLATSKRIADRIVPRRIRGVDSARPTKQGRTAFETKNFAKWASKGYAAGLLGEVKSLTLAYLLTGDTRYGDAAVARGLAVAHLDPNGGPTSRMVSDFADGSCMEAMALVYDCCYSQLDPAQRASLRDAMLARVDPWFQRQMNNLESRVFSAHIWQHILPQATKVALALHGEVSDTQIWLAYVYELWQARVPLLGGEDGGWANGVNYFGTNFHTLLEMPVLFERLAPEVDPFSHPWYRNTIYYQIYAWPPGSASDGFGDGAERGGPPPDSRAMFLFFLGERFQDPAALWYAHRVAGDKSLDSLLTPMLWIDRTLAGKPAKSIRPALPDDWPQARQFRDIGVVSMHTDLAAPKRNLMIAFRSSPYGSFNHMHSDQNSFHLVLGGRRLFCGSGYYIGYGDAHFRDWYTHTRGQNSVLIDDKGQVRGAGGYGRIVRYLHGRQITYCAGDASHAYGDAGLSRFRRHLVFLRPGTLVVYDDLKADHAAKWSWLLHSMHPITSTADGRRLLTSAEPGKAQVDLFGSSPLQISISDQFDPPAVNWRDKKSGGKTIQYPNQWHVRGEPAERTKSARFLAIIQVAGSGAATTLDEPVRHANGEIRVAGWRIDAELDASSSPSLLIQRADGRAALAVDRPEFRAAGKQYRSTSSESVLVEEEIGAVRRVAD